MCGRFALFAPLSLVGARYFDLDQDSADEPPARYNITPGTLISAACMPEPGRVELVPLLWGFRPRWAKDKAPRPINARVEGVAGSPYFRAAFAHRRCLVPASGWYEWRLTEQGKQPYFVTLAPGHPEAALLFAALWEPAGEGGAPSCAILTEPAAPALRFLHERQPLVLDPACRWQWLDPASGSREALREQVHRLDPSALTAFPVSTRVNRPGNDDPALVEPLARMR